METITQEIENEIELANELTVKAIQETYQTVLRSNRGPTICG